MTSTLTYWEMEPSKAEDEEELSQVTGSMSMRAMEFLFTLPGLTTIVFSTFCKLRDEY